ncbi:hypothetical protein QZM15_33035 [Burkholderia sp. AU44665]|uniref:hypothetical protein n=1 Tax=Burkholderia sp. AU44665 TaxID=3059203 RepID=UPI00265E1436|nr:hypothetical protein [Burkholderia sp. AU44665]MDN7703312.1 hypothetical protein [Burkholderia sp. AU44665]
MTEREEFEAWWVRDVPPECRAMIPFLMKRGASGKYSNPRVEGAWEVWQAARRTTPDREAIIEECAKVCDEYAADQWSLYKGRAPYTGSEPGRADPDVQGRSDGADVCAERIRALKTIPSGEKK